MCRAWEGEGGVLIAHLADLHLGYRAYHRLAAGGVNQRERDVATAAQRAVDGVVAARPDLVVVAGDVFHTVRPSNSAIMDGFRLFMRLRRGLPAAPVVLIAGNHDSPRSADTGSILRLLAEIPDVHVVDDAARAVRLERPDVSVLCVPHAALVAEEPPAIEPDPGAGTNVLMVHGTVSGTGVDEQLMRMVEYGGAHLERAALREDAFDYIALGHYHNATRIAPNMWYAGATERTATNIWAEADTRKGWVLFDTEARQGEYRDIRTREVVDLPRFSARRGGTGEGGEGAEGGEGGEGGKGDAWLDPAEIDARIGDAVARVPGGVAGKIVRLVITEIPREAFRRLDHRRIRAIKAEALHFQLDARRPEARRSALENAGERRRTLEEELDAFLSGWTPQTPGIERERLRELGIRYLADTEDWREVMELELEGEGSNSTSTSTSTSNSGAVEGGA
ncbi:MAG TPA: DNA repair exonuclease [Longimicrobiales bacterium]|nr:DNA repair exonuclease [Longimicrobiales bacterium]